MPETTPRGRRLPLPGQPRERAASPAAGGSARPGRRGQDPALRERFILRRCHTGNEWPGKVSRGGRERPPYKPGETVYIPVLGWTRVRPGWSPSLPCRERAAGGSPRAAYMPPLHPNVLCITSREGASPRGANGGVRPRPTRVVYEMSLPCRK